MAPLVSDTGPHRETNSVPVLIMESELVIMLLLFLNMVLMSQRKKRNGKLCVHPIFTFILINGTLFTLFDEPGKDEMSFLNYFSMCISSCSKLHIAIENRF